MRRDRSSWCFCRYSCLCDCGVWCGSCEECWLKFILKYEEVIGRSHGDDIFFGVPGGVQDLLVEI